MNKDEIIQAEKQYIVQTYVRAEVVFTHGQGAYLFDSDGKQYLDFSSGIAVTALGHSDRAWVTAVSQQAATLTHVSNLFHTAPHVELAKNLVEHSFADKVFFCNSGAEANEAAIKFARKWKNEGVKGGKGERVNHPTPPHPFTPAPLHPIIAFSGGFHGRTIGALSVTYKEQYREPFAPLMPGVVFAEYNNLDSARAAINDDTCAVIVEPVQGEAGVHAATPEFLQGLRDLCDRHGALLIFDEVQCGLGRTGHLWAHEAYGVKPDIMTLAKPLAGGLPIGAALVTDEVAAALKSGDHGSTFAAGPLVCAAANVVFERVSRPEFLAQVQDSAAYLKHRLETLESEQIVEVRAAGLLIGIEMKSPVKPLIAAARDKGLMLINAGENVLRLAPPLIITKGQIDTAVQIIEECLA